MHLKKKLALNQIYSAHLLKNTIFLHLDKPSTPCSKTDELSGRKAQAKKLKCLLYLF